jgi:hypothetical protein
VLLRQRPSPSAKPIIGYPPDGVKAHAAGAPLNGGCVGENKGNWQGARSRNNWPPRRAGRWLARNGPVLVKIPAVTYFPTPLPEQYRRRWGVSLPCSGWERVGPPRSNHQEITSLVCTIFHELARALRPQNGLFLVIFGRSLLTGSRRTARSRRDCWMSRPDYSNGWLTGAHIWVRWYWAGGNGHGPAAGPGILEAVDGNHCQRPDTNSA